MKPKRINFLVLRASLILFTISLAGRHCYSQAPEKSPEEEARHMLSSADIIKVEVQIVGYPNGDPVNTLITKFKPTELHAVVKNLKLGAKREKISWGTDVTPIVYLNFFEKGREKGALSIGYGYYAFDYFMPPMPYFPQYRLDATTDRQLRHIIARKEEIMKTLRDMGCSAQVLDPNYIPPFEE